MLEQNTNWQDMAVVKDPRAVAVKMENDGGDLRTVLEILWES